MQEKKSLPSKPRKPERKHLPCPQLQLRAHIICVRERSSTHDPVYPMLRRTIPDAHALHEGLGRKAQLGAGVSIEDNELALEEDVPEDVDADAGVGLEAAEAGRAARVGGGVVDVRARDGGVIAADGEGDGREGGATRVGVAALGLVVLGAGDAAVVGSDDGVVEEEQGGAGVGDGVADGAAGGAAVDAVAVGCEAPEAAAAVDGDVGDCAGVGGVVDAAEAVGSGLAFLEVGGEERG